MSFLPTFTGLAHVEVFNGVNFSRASTSLTSVMDADGIRDNGPQEGTFAEDVTEILATVQFDDGSFGTVLGLQTVRAASFGMVTASFVFEASALSVLGQDVTDVARVLSFVEVDHDLSFFDLGFSLRDDLGPPPPGNDAPSALVDVFRLVDGETVTGNVLLNDTDPDGDPLTAFLTSVPENDNLEFNADGSFSFTADLSAGTGTVVSFGYQASDGSLTDNAGLVFFISRAPDPDAEPEPIIGTGANDRLDGTNGDDILIGGDGNDRLRGLDGDDTFVFGADARDGNRDRDVIRDFEDGDRIVLEEGAEIQRIIERNGDAIIRLEGDRDVIVVRDADAGIIDSITFEEGAFLI